MLYDIVLGVHACAMLAALFLFAVCELLLLLARRGQAPAARLALLAVGAGNVMAGIGVLAGIVLVLVGGWPLRTPWLLASLVLIAALMAIRRTLVRPWEARVRSALGNDDVPNAQIGVFAREQNALIGLATVIALFVVVAVLMVMKPAFALFPLR